MAANKKTVVKKNPAAHTPETALRQLWLAGLGVVVIARRETLNAAGNASARLDALKRQGTKLVGDAQDNVRGSIASVREQGEARVGQFSAEVEARLAPVLVKLGLKHKPIARTRTRKSTKKAARANRHPTSRKATSKRVAAKRH